jgi:hypothetical protein
MSQVDPTNTTPLPSQVGPSTDLANALSGDGVRNGGSQSDTIQQSSQGPVDGNRPDTLSALPENQAQAQLAAALAREATLRAQVETLRERHNRANEVNARIAELEAEKAALRADLRLTTTPGSSLRRDPRPASYAIPTPSTSI